VCRLLQGPTVHHERLPAAMPTVGSGEHAENENRKQENGRKTGSLVLVRQKSIWTGGAGPWTSEQCRPQASLPMPSMMYAPLNSLPLLRHSPIPSLLSTHAGAAQLSPKTTPKPRRSHAKQTSPADSPLSKPSSIIAAMVSARHRIKGASERD
jgi:hypothetical protein